MRKLLLALFAVCSLLMLSPPREVRAAPTGLSTTQTCNGNTADVTFTWRDVSSGSRQLWIDLSTQTSWRANTYLSAGPIGTAQNSYTWKGIKLNTQHFYRLEELL